ncbi:MAG: heavy-metal-associated domain-containing protein, partial [Elusimicrobiota bacterium]|nr:heavy-metal-associated domain-containing protein [Elusimicrobiota bacterium]
MDRQMERQVLNIADMTFSAQRLIEKTLGKLKGIENVSVNLISGKVFIEFDGAEISPSQIKKTLGDAGFESFESLQ